MERFVTLCKDTHARKLSRSYDEKVKIVGGGGGYIHEAETELKQRKFFVRWEEREKKKSERLEVKMTANAA